MELPCSESVKTVTVFYCNFEKLVPFSCCFIALNMSSTSQLWSQAKQNSLSYGRNKAAFVSRLSRPPLNPIVDSTPFSKLTTITALPVLLADFVSVMKLERFHERAITKMDRLVQWFPSWQARQPSFVLECFTVRNVADIRALIRDIAAAHHGPSDEQYLDYQQEWPWVHAVIVAMLCKRDWHPQCIWHSALWHSDYYGCGQSPRAHRLLPKCYVLPSIYGHVAAQEAKGKQVSLRNVDDHDVRSYFEFDPAAYGGRGKRKRCSCGHHGHADAQRMLLGAVPQCSQQVVLRQRICKSLKRKAKKAAHNRNRVRTLDIWLQSARRKH